MSVLVTGSAGHLGEALVRTLRSAGRAVVGLDRRESEWTSIVGSITDCDVVERALRGVREVVHAATLHKPHVAGHARSRFVDVNVQGTLNLLEGAVAAGVRSFVFTSTTSTFGQALRPPPGQPAAWITEAVPPVARNIYGATKCAAEDLCRLFYQDHGLPCVVLRTSRFFLEEDDDPERRAEYEDENLKVNECVHRRVDLADVVGAHRLALERAADLGYERFIISATTPFEPGDAGELRRDAPAVLARRVPAYTELYSRRGWRMLPALDRIYDNARARTVLGWRPRFDFSYALERIAAGQRPFSDLALSVGTKGYHPDSDTRYPFL